MASKKSLSAPSRRGRVLRSPAALLACALGALLLSAQHHVFGQQVGAYYGTNSAGLDAEVYVGLQNGTLYVTGIGLSGHEFCNGKRVPRAELGGDDGFDVDGRIYPIVDGRATFSSLQPQFYVQTDLKFSGNVVRGTAVYDAPRITGTGFPPQHAGLSSCTTGRLTFTATFAGNVAVPRRSSLRQPGG